MIRKLCLFLIIIVGFGCTKVSSPQNRLPNNTAEVRPSQLIATVIGVLEDHHGSGSLVFRGHCTDSGSLTDFLKTSSPAHDATPIEVLRHALAHEAGAYKTDSFVHCVCL